MSESSLGVSIFEPTSPDDRRLAMRAQGVLRELNQAGVVTAADVHVATRLARMAGESREPVIVAVALAARAVGSGSTCLDVSTVGHPLLDAFVGDDASTSGWLAQVETSPLVTAGVLRVDNGLLYLGRYHEQEVQVADDLLARAAVPTEPANEAVLEAGLARLFDDDSAEQRAASRAAAFQRTTVLTGGPGTGKTTTVARLLALLVEQAELAPETGAPRIALTAPTAKAATRLREAVAQATAQLPDEDRDRLGDLDASTMHRLLGWRPGSSSRFKHDRDNRLPHDIVVLDEASMVPLTLMARLLEALRPDARLLVVGDPDQLLSVDAGAVLADLVAGLSSRETERVSPVVTLTKTYRFGGAIGELAQAVRDGDADRAVQVLTSGAPGVELVPDAAGLRSRLVTSAIELRRLALAGDATAALAVLGQHRLLCAHRAGPFGVAAWNRHIEQWMSEETGDAFWAPMYPGRPVLVTSNDYPNNLLNGDTGVVIRSADGHLRAVMDTARGEQTYAASRLSEIDTMHAMTVHKAQGSQVRDVTLLLPELDSPLLSRELLYTGITRAEESVTVVGSEEALRAAIARRVQRASGLAPRLRASG